MLGKTYKWAVVGAGPAGIYVVNKILSFGIDPKDLLWIDPCFKVGDLGKYWSNVASNTKVKLFTKFLNTIDTYVSSTLKNTFIIDSLNQDETCKLQYIVEPLQWITDSLCNKVVSCFSKINKINFANNVWTLHGDNITCFAEKVVLATGATPKRLDYSLAELDFEDAIDKDKLIDKISRNETVAVFGASHSAFIIIRNLVELGVKRVINFYNNPCKYAVDMGDWILFDNTGLKGDTAIWVHENIDGTLPNNLVRYISDADNIARYLPEADKVVYAIGFEARQNIQVCDFKKLHYNHTNGILAPGLFGIGIAYPELKSDILGNFEYQVGIWKFAQYLDKIFPVWVKYNESAL